MSHKGATHLPAAALAEVFSQSNWRRRRTLEKLSQLQPTSLGFQKLREKGIKSDQTPKLKRFRFFLEKFPLFPVCFRCFSDLSGMIPEKCRKNTENRPGKSGNFFRKKWNLLSFTLSWAIGSWTSQMSYRTYGDIYGQTDRRTCGRTYGQVIWKGGLRLKDPLVIIILVCLNVWGVS